MSHKPSFLGNIHIDTSGALIKLRHTWIEAERSLIRQEFGLLDMIRINPRLSRNAGRFSLSKPYQESEGSMGELFMFPTLKYLFSWPFSLCNRLIKL